MPIPNKARTGGPKTASGRKAVSNNAVKHGLAAVGPVTTAEAALVDSLYGALLAQYDPQTPLEKLQIARIARSAAKLQRLHEIEEAAFHLAQENACPTVEEIVAAMGPTDAAVQADAARILQGHGRPATFGLDDALLAQICDEIRDQGHKVATYADVQALLPATHAYVEQSCQQNGTSDPPLQLQALMAGLRPVPPPVRPRPRPTEFDSMTSDELMALIMKSEREKGVVWVRLRPQDDPAAQAKGLQEDLKTLLHVQQHRRQVDDLVQRYPGRRALLQQAALPPAEEADRLMRYQVALDRQLSKCTGELLQMLAMRPPRAS